MKKLEEFKNFYDNSIVGVRVGSLYVYNQDLYSNKAFCYCSSCNRSNIEISISKLKYWVKHNKNITCGCKLEEVNDEKQLVKLGTSYSKITVVKRLLNKKYECLCVCGNLEIVDEEDLINKRVTQCNNCENKKEKEADKSYKDKIRKELYYIWNLYLYLYVNPTENFKQKVIDNNIKFFTEFNDNFDLFFEWALNNNYRKEGAIYLEREDKKQDYTVNNCKWIEKDNNKFIDLPNSILKNSKDEVLEKDNLNREVVEIAKSEEQKEVEEARENLYEYFYRHYGIDFVPKSIDRLLKQLNNGSSKTYENVKITYEEMSNMLIYYENDLFNLYKYNIENNRCTTPNQRMAYDISVMIDRLKDYRNRREILYNQVNNNKVDGGEELRDYSQHFKWLEIQRQKESREKFEKSKEIEKFAEELVKPLFED